MPRQYPKDFRAGKKKIRSAREPNYCSTLLSHYVLRPRHSLGRFDETTSLENSFFGNDHPSPLG